MKLIIDIDEEWYSYIIASKDYIDKDDEAYLILNGMPYEERPKGYWLQAYLGFNDFYKCNICKGLNPVKSNFCPNCGADMRGGAE